MTEEPDDLTHIPLDLLRQRRSAKWTTYPPNVLPAFVAEMDFPLATPVKEALHRAIDADDTGYANASASRLPAAFAGFAERRFGWTPDPGRVTVTADVVGGLKALLAQITRPGARVIVTPPVYHPFFSIVPEVGAETTEAMMSEAGRLDLNAIEEGFSAGARAILLCSPHNPLGTLPSRDELAELAELAVAHDAWVLADEIHAPLTLAGARHTPFLEVSPAARECGICVTSASKAFNVAGLGCALIVTAGERATRLVSGLSPGDTHPGHLGVIAAEAAFEAGDDWLDRVLDQLDHNRKLLAGLLDRWLPQARYRQPAAGYLAWIDARGLGLGPDPSVPILERARVAVSGGPGFGTGGTGYFRLNFGTSPELVEAAVRSIAEVV